MKIYVINLDQSVDRLDYMTKMCRNLRLDFTRVAAVDKNIQYKTAVRYSGKKFMD